MSCRPPAHALNEQRRREHAHHRTGHPPSLRRGGLWDDGKLKRLGRVDIAAMFSALSREEDGLRITAHAKIKTDTIDAKVLAQLYASGLLPEVGFPDGPTQALRRK